MHSRHVVSCARAALVGGLLLAPAARPAGGQAVTFSTVATDPYFAGDINSCAIGINNLTTVGDHQFVAYYNTARNVMIGRRALGFSTWQTLNTGLTPPTSGQISDDHNVIAIAVDGDGFLHTAWNMHDQPLRYAISNAPVTGATFEPVSFTQQTAANAPTLFPSGGTTTNSVTYPQFYPIPGTGDLLLTYRNGASGGGNQYFNVFNNATNTWTNNLAIDGNSSGVNGYINTLARTSTGELMMSWTWRATPNWQTNSDIMFARSPDNGATWQRQDGTPYPGPITQTGPNAGQVIKNIPQNSSLINQTSMTVDNADRPMVATWWAPDSGDPNRQYMLVHFDGSTWKTSQITHRTSDASIDTSAFAVRDLGRPIVLVDDADRVLVVTRSTDTHMGAYDDAGTPDNEIVVYYNTVAGLNGETTTPWQSVTLDNAHMGSWEPTYDANLWRAEKKLSLFYEPVGIAGQSGSTLRVLDWDPAAYFASLNHWVAATGGDWDTAGNWSNAVPDAVGALANFGGGMAPTSDSTISLNGTKTVGTISFGSPTYSYHLVSGVAGALALDNGTGPAAQLSATSGSHSIVVPVSIDADGVDVGVSDGATLTISGNISGAGGLRKNSGGGVLVLSGSNSYTGTTTVSSGRLRLMNAAALSGSNLTLTGGMLESAVNLTRQLGSSAGRIRVTGGGMSGFAASGADVTFTLTNGGNPVSWGSTNFNPGTLVLNAPDSTHNVTIAGNISLGTNDRSVFVNPGVNGLGGVISGSSGATLLVDGPGTLLLSSTNTYTGGTTLNAVGQGPGTVRASANGALGTGTIITGPQGNATTARLELIHGITLNNNITFTGRTNQSVAVRNIGGNNVLGGNVTLAVGGNNYRVEAQAGNLTLAGSISSNATGTRLLTLEGAADGVVSGAVSNGTASMAVAKSGSGTWTLSGNNTYTGGTTVNAGTLRVNRLHGNNPVNIVGGTLQIVASNPTLPDHPAGNIASVSRPSSLNISPGATLDLTNNDLILAYIGATPIAAIEALVASGYNVTGDWQGDGITSSVARLDGSYALAVADNAQLAAPFGTAQGGPLFAGVDVDLTTVLIKFTHRADVDLDGLLTPDDAAIFGTHYSEGDFANRAMGDMDYDGVFTPTDAAIFGTFYDESLASLPEPACLGALGLAGVFVARRSRRVRRGTRFATLAGSSS